MTGHVVLILSQECIAAIHNEDEAMKGYIAPHHEHIGSLSAYFLECKIFLINDSVLI